MTLLELGGQVLVAVRKRSESSQAEAYLVQSESRTQEWSEGRPENLAARQKPGHRPACYQWWEARVWLLE